AAILKAANFGGASDLPASASLPRADVELPAGAAHLPVAAARELPAGDLRGASLPAVRGDRARGAASVPLAGPRECGRGGLLDRLRTALVGGADGDSLLELLDPPARCASARRVGAAPPMLAAATLSDAVPGDVVLVRGFALLLMAALLTGSLTLPTRSLMGEISDGHLGKWISRAAAQAAKVAEADGDLAADCPIVSCRGGRRVAADALLGATLAQPIARMANDILGLDLGLEVRPVKVFVGVKGACAPNGKDAVFVEFSDEEPVDFIARLAHRDRVAAAKAQPDARALSVKIGPGGKHTPLGQHLAFRSTCSLKPEQRGVAEHETLPRIIELAGQYDQLVISNLACAGAAAMRVQTIEWAYRDKIRETDARSSSRLSIEEATAFSGLSRAGDLLMAPPSLLEHAKSQVEQDAAPMKNMRKAKEERELRRKQKDKLGWEALGGGAQSKPAPLPHAFPRACHAPFQ
ncbi:unnamed protein product, partial [Prorocentrum cordatum]